MPTNEDVTRALAEALQSHIEGQPRDVQVKMLGEAIESITYGMRAGVVPLVDALIRESLGESYVGWPKFKARVKALEKLATIANKIAYGEEPRGSSSEALNWDDFRAAIDALEAPQTG